MRRAACPVTLCHLTLSCPDCQATCAFTLLRTEKSRPGAHANKPGCDRSGANVTVALVRQWRQCDSGAIAEVRMRRDTGALPRLDFARLIPTTIPVFLTTNHGRHGR